jgi:5-methylcytosine-specific restriction protein A
MQRPCLTCGQLTTGSYCPEHDRRPFATATRTTELYSTAEWKRESKAFVANKLCITACGRVAAITDHEPPHRGDPAAFWDRNRWRAYCRRCHNAKTGRETRQRVKEARR